MKDIPPFSVVLLFILVYVVVMYLYLFFGLSV